MSDPLRDAMLRPGMDRLLVVTGAGVSLASGIPTFRGKDPGAIWARDVTELGTVRHFSEDPVSSWSWYLSRFGGLEGKLPNPAHHALVALEQWQQARGGHFLLCTQNVDLLHEAAGSKAMVKVHGSADRVRCSAYACVNGAPKGSLARASIDQATFLANPSKETVPRCPACDELLRQHVLWFDEYYNGHDDYQYARLRKEAAIADLVLFAGTSFSVGITEMVCSSALQSGAAIFSIDPSGRVPDARITAITEPAEVVLPRLVSQLQS